MKYPEKKPLGLASWTEARCAGAHAAWGEGQLEPCCLPAFRGLGFRAYP